MIVTARYDVSNPATAGTIRGVTLNVGSYSMSALSQLPRWNLGIPLLLLVLLAMMTLRIPPFLLDIFFTFNIAVAVVVLLVSVYALRPLDFGAFPTILLVATLSRLALNVASDAGGAAGGPPRRGRCR